MKKCCAIIYLLFVLVSAGFAQGLIWSEPVRLDDFGGASSPNIICDKFGRLWASWAEGDSLTGYRTRAKYLEDSVWHDAGTFWEGSGYRPDCMGAQTDSTIWVFNRQGGGIRAAYYKDGVWCDTLTIDYPLISVYNFHCVEDISGNLWLIYTQSGTDAVRYTVYDSSSWSLPINYTPGYILDAIIDRNNQLRLLWQSHPYVIDGIPVAKIYTSCLISDSFSMPESLFVIPYPLETIYPTGYMSPNGEVCLATCFMDSLGKRTIRVYHYFEGILDSAYLDTVTGPYLPGKYACIEKNHGNIYVFWSRGNVGETHRVYGSIFDWHIWTTPELVIGDPVYSALGYNTTVDDSDRVWLINNINTDTLRRAVFAQHIIDTTDGIGEEKVKTLTPRPFSLDNTYPNPFNSEIKIKYSLYTSVEIDLEIYDLSGRLVRVLQSGILKRGIYSVVWNVGDYPSGIYFVKMKTNEKMETKKLILIK